MPVCRVVGVQVRWPDTRVESTARFSGATLTKNRRCGKGSLDWARRRKGRRRDVAFDLGRCFEGPREKIGGKVRYECLIDRWEWRQEGGIRYDLGLEPSPLMRGKTDPTLLFPFSKGG